MPDPLVLEPRGESGADFARETADRLSRETAIVREILFCYQEEFLIFYGDFDQNQCVL